MLLRDIIEYLLRLPTRSGIHEAVPKACVPQLATRIVIRLVKLGVGSTEPILASSSHFSLVKERVQVVNFGSHRFRD